ncbi:MAG: HEAT repeat domain-containing protein [Steroidobacteraceae bacterium]
MNTGSELIVMLAWRSAEFAALAAALMMLIALLVRQHLRREERLRARVVDSWRPLLTQIAIENGDLPPLPALRRRELPFFMEVWNALHDVLRGESADRLNALAPRYGLDVIARRGLQSRSISGRILAIRTLGHLRDASAWKGLQEQLASSNALVSFYAAAALVSIDATRAMPGIMLQLAERESWPGEAMARLLVDAGSDISREPIRALMLSLAPDKTPALLPWLSHVDAVLGSEVATELLRRNPGHDGIAAAALLVVQEPALLAELAGFADSADAGIRENLAQACGRLGGLGETDLLVRLLSDRVWWVRYRAAQALLKLKGMDSARLEAVRAVIRDPYARDMLEQARAEAALT